MNISGVEVIQADVLDGLRGLPDSSVHCVVTSPPYFGLRKYEGVSPTTWADGSTCELGLEATPDAYVEHMLEIFRELRRVLRADGSVHLNLGDSYASASSYNGEQSVATENGWKQDGPRRPNVYSRAAGLKAKDLVLVPARVALALQADGWWVRAENIWAKGISFCESYSGSVMPESATDRTTIAHEHVWHLTPSAHYFYDHLAIAERAAWERWGDQTVPKYEGSNTKSGWMQPSTAAELKRKGSKHRSAIKGGQSLEADPSGLRNVRSVWAIPVEPYAGAHFAVMPTKLATVAIKASTSEQGCCPRCGAPAERLVEREDPEYDGSRYGERVVDAAGGAQSGGTAASTLGSPNGKLVGQEVTVGWQRTCEHEDELEPAVVLDPFLGSGTTAVAALRLGRRCIGIEASAEYEQLYTRRISEWWKDAPRAPEPPKDQLALEMG